MVSSVLAVHAHPDDEAIWTGGTLARYADEGARTAVVTCTWAEGTVRAGELERSLGILGAGEPRLLGYADARKPESAPGRPRFVDVPLDEAVGRVVESEVGRGASMTLLTALPERARAQMLANEWYRRIAYTGPAETALS